MDGKLTCLRDASDTVPFEALEGLIAAALADAAMLDQLSERYEELYSDNVYERTEFEVVYLPYVMTEIARRGTPEVRGRVILQLLEMLHFRLDEDDEGAFEFLGRCLQSLPANETAPAVLAYLRENINPVENPGSISYWDILEPVWQVGTEEIKRDVAQFAMECLRRAQTLEKVGPSIQFVCYRLAELKELEALPLMEAIEKRMRQGARHKFEEIDANGVRDAMDILQGKRGPYEIKDHGTLRDMVVEERKLYADWYATREEADVREEYDTGDEEDEPMMPVYSDETLRKLEFKEGSKAFTRDSKIGRNDPCPCRSGKKYKKCCGR